MIRRWGNESGLSLTETLAALVVFLTVAAGLAASTVAVIRGNSVSRKTAAAAALAEGKIEEFRALGSVAAADELKPGKHDDPLNPLTALGESHGSFVRSWTVTPASPHEGLAMVEVTVSWDAPQPGSVTSVTLICENAACM